MASKTYVPSAKEIAAAKAKGFRMAAGASKADYDYIMKQSTGAIDVRKSASEQNWGAGTGVATPLDKPAIPWQGGGTPTGVGTQAVAGAGGTTWKTSTPYGEGTYKPSLTPEQRMLQGMLASGRSTNVSRVTNAFGGVTGSARVTAPGGLVGAAQRSADAGAAQGAWVSDRLRQQNEAWAATRDANYRNVTRPVLDFVSRTFNAQSDAYDATRKENWQNFTAPMLYGRERAASMPVPGSSFASPRMAAPSETPARGVMALLAGGSSPAAAVASASAGSDWSSLTPEEQKQRLAVQELRRNEAWLRKAELPMGQEASAYMSEWDNALRRYDATGDRANLPEWVPEAEFGLISQMDMFGGGGHQFTKDDRDTAQATAAQALINAGYEYIPGVGLRKLPILEGGGGGGYASRQTRYYGGGGGYGGYGSSGRSNQSQGILWRIGIT